MAYLFHSTYFFYCQVADTLTILIVLITDVQQAESCLKAIKLLLFLSLSFTSMRTEEVILMDRSHKRM